MKYAVMGTGGTGGCIGGYLAAAGRDVDLIARGEHLKAIKQNGLTVESSDRGIIHIQTGPVEDTQGIRQKGGCYICMCKILLSGRGCGVCQKGFAQRHGSHTRA